MDCETLSPTVDLMAAGDESQLQAQPPATESACFDSRQLQIARKSRWLGAALIRKNLRAMTGDGAMNSAMVGVGENYLAAFALAAGAGEVVAGLVTSAPLLAGALLQLMSPWAVRKLGSNKRWVVLCSALQAASLLPLALAAVLGGISAPLLLLVTALYWSASLACGPAWNTWVGPLVPNQVRARYFARRNRISQACILAGFIGGGMLLQYGEAQQHLLLTFAILFCIASLCRFISVGFLASQTEPIKPATNVPLPTLAVWFARLRAGGHGRLLWYLIAMQGSAQLAGPYFSPFMLGERKFSYAAYVIVIATSLLAKSIASPLLGMIAHRAGARQLLTLGGLAVIPLPLFWLISTRLDFLIVVQTLAGVSWAAYELATSLIYFEAIEPRERTGVLTTLNVGHSLATVAGSLLGGAILSLMGATNSAYLTVFALSGVARFATLPLLWRLQHVHRPAVHVAYTDDGPEHADIVPLRRSPTEQNPVVPRPAKAG